ncbi:Mcm10 protein [Martiniozyma asiatica (nom. inval.)]|nr:Mcm10 protein [Martiniozyma asiatica]
MSELEELERIEGDILNQLEKIRQLREEKKRELIENVLSEEELEKESVDPRSVMGYIGKKRQTVKEEPSSNIYNTKGRYKGNIPTSDSSELLLKKKVEEQLEREKLNKRILTKSKSGILEDVNSLVAQTRKTHDKILKRQKEKLESSHKHSEGQLFSFDLPSNYERINQEVKSTKPINESINNLTSYDKYKDPAYDELSHRLLSHWYMHKKVLLQTMKGIKPLTLQKLVYQTQPPKFERPKYPNFAVVGIVCKKSDILTASDGITKYRRIILTDFNIDVMLFIWKDALKRYPDVSLGNVVAILNPDISSYNLKPRKGTTGTDLATSFSLKISMDINNMLIYGRCLDFGICEEISFGGRRCDTAVDKRKTRYCTYHSEKRYKKATSNRVDLTGSYYSFGAKDKRGNKASLYRSVAALEQEAGQQKYHVEAKPNSGKINKNFHAGNVLTDLSDPMTAKNLMLPHEKNQFRFSSEKASLAFYHNNVKNEDAIKKQKLQKELDLKLKKEKAKTDYKTKVDMEKARKAEKYKKIKQDARRNMKKELNSLAGCTEKDLALSKEDRKRKTTEWNANLNKLEKLKHRKLVEGENGLEMILKDKKNDSSNIDNDKKMIFMDFDSDDDSDV